MSEKILVEKKTLEFWGKALSESLFNKHISKQIRKVLEESNKRADGWISVEDRLPTKEEEYNIYTVYGDARWVSSSKYVEKVWQDGYGGRFITHWQPLPVPPVSVSE
jgi:hypothetical protein